jgi:hypothetical protein
MASKVSYRLETKGLKELKKNTKKLKGRSVDWGFLSGTHSGSGLTYASLASILEYGAVSNNGNRIPPRPAFGDFVNSLRASNKQYELALQKHFSDLVTGVVKSPENILKVSGEHLTSRHQTKMEFWIMGGSKNTGNAPMTVSAKGFNQPFVDSGELVRSVDYRKN